MRLREFIVLSLLFSGALADYTPLPRWGQAQALVNSALLVHGGKTDQYNSYSYTSAPTNNDILYLSFASSFDVSSPPWQYVGGSEDTSTNQGPTLAWHTLSAYNSTQLLVFGGDGGPNSPIVLPSQANSAMLMDVQNILSPAWISEATSWAWEPIRRIHHSTSTAQGMVWLIGGEKDDGSNNGFSEHYVFDPSVPSFSQLPTSGGPPDLYGHTSVVLSDGRLLVFGGYSESQSLLLPLTTIWAMDTTQTGNLSWTSISVSGTSVPTARRAFAATVVGGNQVLIHGGADAVLQTSYADGWILDTTQEPMVWSNVSALSALGARRDHFALALGTDVVFGFGYGTSAGAPAALMIYDTSSNVFLTSFTPPSPSSTASPTLPAPTGTAGGNGGSSGSNGSGSNHHQGSQTGSATALPDSTSASSSDGHSTGSSSVGEKAGIALGSLFGILALAGVTAAAGYYVRKRHDAQQRFHLLGDTEDDENSSGGRGALGLSALNRPPREKLRMAGSGWIDAGEQRSGWAHLGLGRGARDVQRRERVDMLADEDARQFDIDSFHVVSRRGSSGSSRWSGYGRSNTMTDVVNGSLNQLRSVGAIIGSTVGIGNKSREARANEWWEKEHVALDPFSDNAALLRGEGNNTGLTAVALGGVGALGGGIAARPRRGHDTSEPSSSGGPYVDPFADTVDVIHDAGHEMDQNEAEVDESTSLTGVAGDHLWSNAPRSPHSAILPPLTEISARYSLSDVATSVESHDSPFTGTSTQPGTSQTSHENRDSPNSSTSPAFQLRSTSIIGGAQAPTQPITRSDSWWSKFALTPFLDRRSSDSRRPHNEPLEIRDPNPVPKLVPIREASSNTNSPESADLNQSPNFKRRQSEGQPYGSTSHQKSLSSLRTAHTADSDVIERMGGNVDVVLRNRSLNSHHNLSPSAGGTSVDSEVTVPWLTNGPPELFDTEASDRSEHTYGGMVVQSPTQGDATGLDEDGLRTPPTNPPASGRPVSGGAVASRIQAYERRMSQDAAELGSPTSPGSPRNTRKREDRRGKPVISVNYGLVTRPPLFVANPDHRQGQSSDS